MDRLPPLVFVHVHYPDIWESMAVEIAAAMDRPFGLILTHRPDIEPPVRPCVPNLDFFHTLQVENRGRDVLPFLKALRGDLPSFEIGLKLHTKRSPHRGDGADWRQFLTSSLLQRDDTDLVALKLMERDARIGLIAPEGHLLPLEGRVVLNGRIVNRMARKLELAMSLSDIEAQRFAAGSMFWFKRDALKPFRDSDLDSLFVREKGQLDGTAAHAAERLFALLCEKRGYLATAMEAVEPLLRSEMASSVKLSELPTATIKATSDEALERSKNPFILPMAQFWRRHSRLLLVAHFAYNHLPKPIWRTARKFLKRYTTETP